MTIKLREWTWFDLPVLAALRADAELQAQLMAKPKQNDVHEWLARRTSDPAGAFFIIDHEGACAGFVQLTQVERGESAWVGICVAPGRQGQGIGAQALSLIEAHARESFAARVVKLKVLQSNTRAISLYERHGFRRSGDDGDACLMEKV
ncbi:MAG: GNAT family N-acetyltransferase [Myxococcaceae bacterium]|nr:GNAT family N-acetyltransferase [Myxococcaceae bacterium]